MTQIQSYTVTGMTCGHCVASVTEQVKEIPGVDAVTVVLDSGAVAIASEHGVDDADVRTTVKEAGYDLI